MVRRTPATELHHVRIQTAGRDECATDSVAGSAVAARENAVRGGKKRWSAEAVSSAAARRR